QHVLVDKLFFPVTVLAVPMFYSHRIASDSRHAIAAEETLFQQQTRADSITRPAQERCRRFRSFEHGVLPATPVPAASVCFSFSGALFRALVRKGLVQHSDQCTGSNQFRNGPVHSGRKLVNFLFRIAESFIVDTLEDFMKFPGRYLVP
ncbi:hypothetical protein LCGC14_3033930, partial [marine sediment metagenome]